MDNPKDSVSPSQIELQASDSYLLFKKEEDIANQDGHFVDKLVSEVDLSQSPLGNIANHDGHFVDHLVSETDLPGKGEIVLGNIVDKYT